MCNHISSTKHREEEHHTEHSKRNCRNSTLCNFHVYILIKIETKPSVNLFHLQNALEHIHSFTCFNSKLRKL